MSKKKVLIAIVDAGNGHRRAAESIDITLQKLYPDQFEVKIMDILKVADVEPFNTSDASYSLVSKNTFLDNINIFVCQVLNLSIPYDLFKSYAVGRLKSAFKDIIDEHNPDLVICNHPVPAMVLGDIRRERDDFKYVINVLDLVTFFRALADRNADLISAPTMNIAEDLVKLGVNLNKVIYPVFPVHPKLKDSTPRDIFLESIGLETSKPVVLITGGGLGSKTLKSAIIKLSKRSDLQLVIIAGRLTYFKNELEVMFKGYKNIKVYGFVDNMQDFFRSADIVIAKPGATTVVECELLKKKAIFTKRVGHVEIGHDKYVQSNPLFRYIGTDWKRLDILIDELLNLDSAKDRDPSISKRDYNEVEILVKNIVKLLN